MRLLPRPRAAAALSSASQKDGAGRLSVGRNTCTKKFDPQPRRQRFTTVTRAAAASAAALPAALQRPRRA